MKRIIKALLLIFFCILPIILLMFTSGLANFMRWKLGSPLVPGYNWMRWSHVYLTFGSIFCLALYVPIIMSITKKKLKILFIPFVLTLCFIIFSIVFANISKTLFHSQNIKNLQDEVNKNPDDSLALERMAQSYEHSGNYDKAIELYNQALKITKNPSYVIHDRGLAYMKKGDFDLSIADFTKAMESNQEEKDFIAQSYNDRGNAYYYKGEYDKSWQDVQKALEMGYNVHSGFLAALKNKGYSK